MQPALLDDSDEVSFASGIPTADVNHYQGRTSDMSKPGNCLLNTPCDVSAKEALKIQYLSSEGQWKTVSPNTPHRDLHCVFWHASPHCKGKKWPK